MSQSQFSLSSMVAGVFAAIFLFFSVLIGGSEAFADVPAAPAAEGHIADVHSATTHPEGYFLPRKRPPPMLPPYAAPADAGDSIAALEAIEIALTQASDGATYVWRRHDGRLAGAFRPTSTFRDADGRICRHLEMRMRLGTYQRLIEGIACRDKDGVWNLEG